MAENISPNEGYIARFFQRDSDTLGCWGNTGQLLFKIFHEWGDSFDPATGTTGRIDGERYDAASDSFEPDTTAGSPVFNGRLSGLWDCVEKAWPDDLAAMYRTMRAAGFNADDMWALYQSFRQQWCEALYGADAMGYANTGRFDMAYGDKSEALRHIFRSRFRYLDSKYGANTSTPLEFRLWGNGKGVALRYYCPLYASLNWGAGGIIAERAITPGEPSYFPNPGTTFNETTFTVYNADLLTEISTYAEMPDGTRVEGGLEDIATRCTVSGLGNCKRLKSLVLDYSGRNANSNLDNRVLEACRSVAMRRMVIRNCPNVTGHAEFASQVIEEIDMRGTGVSGVTVPETDTLHTLRLGAEASRLELANLHGLQTLTLEGVDSLAVISVHDCPGADIRPILYEALQTGALRKVSLSGVDWRNFGVRYLEQLADLGAELSGSITLADDANMSFALKQKCMAGWGDIDREDNGLRINYTRRPVEIIRISGAGYYAQEGDYQLNVISDDPYANDFTRIEWSMTANGYADIDTLTGRVLVRRTGTEELAPTAEVTVTVHKTDGTTISKTTTVGFYERTCRLGDFVYADGTYSDVYDEGRTVVCVCCYIDPNDPTRRLGVAPRTIGSNVWGYSERDPALTLSTVNQNVTAFDVFDIPNVAAYPYTTVATNSDESIRDASSEGDCYGFKTYPFSDFRSRIGFAFTDKELGIYPEGAMIPVGLAETLKIISHRNKILKDDNINLPIPVASDTTSEFLNLTDCIAKAKEKQTTLGRLYWPMASYCYAYEPSVLPGETLSDKFKAHKWFLPAPGDAFRLSWIAKQAAVEGSEFDVFNKAIFRNLCSEVPRSIPSTGEYTLFNVAMIASVKDGFLISANGANELYGRAKEYPVYPMVQF